MTREQAELGRALVRAIRSMEFHGRLTEREPTEPHVERGPRVEVRHPHVEHGGALWLLASIALAPPPAITYAVPGYRQTFELVLRALAARAA